MLKAFFISLAINILLIFLYVKYVTPVIKEASESMAKMMLGQ